MVFCKDLIPPEINNPQAALLGSTPCLTSVTIRVNISIALTQKKRNEKLQYPTKSFLAISYITRKNEHGKNLFQYRSEAHMSQLPL